MNLLYRLLISEGFWVILMNYKPSKGVFDEEIKNKFGTIYTPEFVVEKTVNLAFKYLPEGVDPLSLTYCDPSCGDGNFLVHLYDRLMKYEYKESDIGFKMSDVQKSEHILTKCLYGIEILRPMTLACQLRLLNLHLDRCKPDDNKNIFSKLNIYHGNTIMVPEDVGKWEIAEYEGGLLPEEIRKKSYDVIVGNPPYGHLRNQENRICLAYPKQRDMAQIFVRWALDHGNGVISLNTTDAWLRQKLIDGAKETRLKLCGKILEVIDTKEVNNYSADDGGYISTFITCLGINNTSLEFIFNNQPMKYSKEQLLLPMFIDSLISRQYDFKDVIIDTYILKFHRFHTGHKFDKDSLFNQSLFINDSINNLPDLYIACKQNVIDKRGLFKLIKSDNIDVTLQKYDSEIKYCKLPYDIAIFLFAYLSTEIGINEVRTRSKFVHANKNGGKLYTISTPHFLQFHVPDFDYYKINRPAQFTIYMKWIEENMVDKNKFLSGIDEQFKFLIGE